MKLARKRVPEVSRGAPSEQSLRLQEGIRAKKELDAYFKGLRTDREARAALKMIKAFVRARERQDTNQRIPLTTKPSMPISAAKPRKKGTQRASTRLTAVSAAAKKAMSPSDARPDAEPQDS